MRIDGKKIADNLLDNLALKVGQLKKKGIVPTFAVILVGDNPASLSYIKQKQKAAERIGAAVIVKSQESRVKSQQLKDLIEQYNNDPLIHGIILQRPLPESLKLNSLSLCSSILLTKDVDGFIPNSPFTVPVAGAVGEILENVKAQISNVKYKKQNKQAGKEFWNWMRTKNIVIIGRGETAGKPIADYLAKRYFATASDVATISPDFTATLWQRRNNLQCAMSVIHSQTPRPEELIRNADIIISCVGKDRVVTKSNIKPGSILISVGIWRDSEGKLHGDYEEDDIKYTASFYTPTPGGVGPVNVACLMQNLIQAVSIVNKTSYSSSE